MADANGDGASPPSANGNGHVPHSSQGKERRRLFNRQQKEFLWNAFVEQFEQQQELTRNLSSISRTWFSQQADPRRNLYDECGWPGDPSTGGGGAGLSIDLYRTLYDREPLAARVVELMPKECWQQTPTVFEDHDVSNVTQFEEAWDELVNQLRGENSWFNGESGSSVWTKLKRLDIVSGIGSFGVLLLGIDDGKNLQEPIDGVMVTNRHGEGFHDGPMTADEEKALLNPQPRWKEGIVGNKADQALFGPARGIPVREDRLGATPLSAGQKMVVNSWREERERDWVFNAEGGQYVRRVVKRDRGFHNDVREPTVDHARDSRGRDVMGGVDSADRSTSPFEAGRAGFDPTDPANPGPMRANDPAEVFGTDRQYDDIGYGLGMPPPAGELGYSLSGTDEQYFGVQFGPSEMPAPPTDPATSFTDDMGGGSDGVGTGAKQQRGAEDKNRRPRQRPRLLFLRPYGEDMVQIVRYEWNIRNPRFGLPVMYRITLNDPRDAHSGVGLPLATVFVHWSRVIHVAEHKRSSEVFGIPRLRPVLNPILDVQKVRGAGAEGYYKSCFTGLQFVTHPQLGGDAVIDEASLKDSVEQFQNGLQRVLTSRGGSWQTISPSVVDPSPHINAGIEAICIAIGCPVPVFKGYEIGEQASTNNAVEWNKRKYERQWNYLTPEVIVPLVDRLIQVGVLPRPGDAKSKVENLRRTQPWARVERRDGGWLVTNWQRRPVMNSNPEGINQWSKLSQKVKSKSDKIRNSGGVDDRGHLRSKKASLHAEQAADETDRGSFANAADHHETARDIHHKAAEHEESLKTVASLKNAYQHRKAAAAHDDAMEKLRRIVRNAVSPSVGDVRSRQALAIQKDNYQDLRKPTVNNNPEGHNQYTIVGQAARDASDKLFVAGSSKAKTKAQHEKAMNVHKREAAVRKSLAFRAAQESDKNAYIELAKLHEDAAELHKQAALTFNAVWEELPVKYPEKKTGVAAIKAEVAKYDEDQLEGLSVWVNDELGIAVVDRMDWYGKSEDVDPAAEIGRVAERQWGKDRVIYQNEGPCPKGSGWITLNAVSPSVGDEQSRRNMLTDAQRDNHQDPRKAKDEQALTGQAGGKDGFPIGNDPSMGLSGHKANLASEDADGGAEPWEAGQTGVMPGKASALFITDGGYSIEWPDVEALAKKDKATLAGLWTTALAAYMQGGCEALMPFKDYLVHVWGWEEEEAQELVDAAKQMHDEQATLATPPMVGGHAAEAPEGSQAAADHKVAQDQAKQKADAMKEVAAMKQPMPGAKESGFPPKAGAKPDTIKGGGGKQQRPQTERP